MKKYLPFIFPSIAVLIVLFLAFRWYSLNTDKEGQINEFANGVEVESLDIEDVINGNGVVDMEKVDLVDNNGDSQGAVRYQIEDGKVKLSVMTSLPELREGKYQVWFKQINSDAIKKAFVLEYKKGGYLGNAAISSEVLPFEVVVTKEMEDDVYPEEMILNATISADKSE